MTGAGGAPERGAFARVTPGLIHALSDACGSANVLTDRESTEAYGHDETEDLSFAPDVVVRPADAREIAQVLVLAGAHRVPVTPRAGGTGLSGGALPVHGGSSSQWKD